MTNAASDLPAGATILIIEDDAAVTTVLQSLLTIQGLKVLTAKDGMEGVATYREHRATITAVITDMRMPLLDGGGVISALRLINPDVRIVAMSGYIAGSYPGGAKLVVLAKPLNSAELFSALRSVISA